MQRRCYAQQQWRATQGWGTGWRGFLRGGGPGPASKNKLLSFFENCLSLIITVSRPTQHNMSGGPIIQICFSPTSLFTLPSTCPELEEHDFVFIPLCCLLVSTHTHVTRADAPLQSAYHLCKLSTAEPHPEKLRVGKLWMGMRERVGSMDCLCLIPVAKQRYIHICIST